MTTLYPAPIARVVSGSPAAQAGVQAGWTLLAVNGVAIPDILAYRRELARGAVTLLVQNPHGEQLGFTVEWDDPGLEFDEVIFDGLRLCANKCEFCYVHQMPKGMRKSLYIMDDDFRTSFLYGSFVTLTNLSEADITRILAEHLSPLYVSVHATDPALRRDMMRWWRLKVKDPQAADLGQMLKRLAPIDLYTQLVLVPGRNDGAELTASLEYLAAHDNVLAVACVPVGLTDHRVNLPKLRPFTAKEARDALRRIHTVQRRLLPERGTRFAFASDELYLLADEPLPPAEAYEGFQMLENGVGMVRDFLSEPLLATATAELPRQLEAPQRVLLATGQLFAPILAQAVEPLTRIEGLSITVRAIKNRTFGEVTTVAGLLAGRDFLTQIEPGEADLLLVSPNVLKYGTEMLLDERTLDDLRRELRMEVRVGGSTLRALGEAVFSSAQVRSLPQFGFSAHAAKEQ